MILQEKIEYITNQNQNEKTKIVGNWAKDRFRMTAEINKIYMYLIAAAVPAQKKMESIISDKKEL
jgi:hypothetical protein